MGESSASGPVVAPEAARLEEGAVSSQRRAGPDPGDVFESLLAAEQGDGIGAQVLATAAVEIGPAALDHLAEQIVDRLKPNALRDDLQRGLSLGLREAVAETVRDSVVTETRAAVAEAVQAAVNGSLLGTVRGAVNEGIAASVPAAVQQQIGTTLEEVVRTAVAQEIRDAVVPAVRQAVRELLVGGDGRLSEVVHDTADRLVREEIARIRQRRA